MLSRETFDHHVRDALANLYDPVHLQDHPLVALLGVPRGAGNTAGEALRRTLRETIDCLRPAPSVPARRPEWLSYRVLLLRYVRLLEQSAVCAELGLSESTFYRRQREALEALASILWERYERQQTTRDEPLPETFTEARGAIEAARNLPAQTIRLSTLLPGIAETVAPLLAQRGVRLALQLPPNSQMVRAAFCLLRQVFIDLLLLGLGAARGPELTLSGQLAGEETLWRLRGLGGLAPEALEAMDAWKLEDKLARACGGRLWYEAREGRVNALCLALPLAQRRVVLVIEDDAQTIALYQRYLEGEGHLLIGAQTAQQAQAYLAENRPDLLLLDVMLPGTDGWLMLQELKKDSRTAAIPIVICSVLDHPELALALGASSVLKKPIHPEELVRAARQALGETDSSA